MLITISTVLILKYDKLLLLNNWLFDIDVLKQPNTLLSINCKALEYFWNIFDDF